MATSVTTPATSNSEVGVNLDVTTQEAKTAPSSIISDFPEKSNTFSENSSENSGNKKFSHKSGDIDNWGEEGYNLYIATDDFYREVSRNGQHDFARSLANKTSGMQKGEVKAIHIYCLDNVYTFFATGYMRGYMLKAQNSNTFIPKRRRNYQKYEKRFGINGRIARLWSKPVSNQ